MKPKAWIIDPIEQMQLIKKQPLMVAFMGVCHRFSKQIIPLFSVT